MENIKQYINKNYEKLKYFFLASAALSCFNCLAKPDYNLVLYVYAFFVWNMMGNATESQLNEKIYCFFFMIITLIVDFVWIFYWGGLWSSLQHDEESTIHFLVILFSWIGVGVKIASTVMIGIGEWASIKTSLPEKIQNKLNTKYKEQVDDEKF